MDAAELVKKYELLQRPTTSNPDSVITIEGVLRTFPELKKEVLFFILLQMRSFDDE
jgi:hypothetical protein